MDKIEKRFPTKETLDKVWKIEDMADGIFKLKPRFYIFHAF